MRGEGRREGGRGLRTQSLIARPGAAGVSVCRSDSVGRVQEWQGWVCAGVAEVGAPAGLGLNWGSDLSRKPKGP